MCSATSSLSWLLTKYHPRPARTAIAASQYGSCDIAPPRAAVAAWLALATALSDALPIPFTAADAGAAPRALVHCVEEPGRAQLMGQARRNCCRNLILLRREKTREAARVKPGTALLLAEDAHDHRAEHIEKRLACALAQACEFSNRSG